LQRYFIKLAYNGSAFQGWQIQPNAITVQEEIEKALGLVLSETINVIGCGRTDTGVHAREYYAHFNTNSNIEKIKNIKQRLNGILGEKIAIYDVFEVHPLLHSRFDAVSRNYHYYIHQKKDPFLNQTSYFYSFDLDIEIMNKATALMKHYTDFKSFSKVKTEVNNFNCEIFEAEWKMENNQLVFSITANRFLRNMVRAIVGTMLKVGRKKISLDDFCQIIESRNRSAAGQSVPGHALFLNKINYPENAFNSPLIYCNELK
jgi:tRNA pseudouridine38-40 synthase